jgi:hypothetical protein
MLTIDLTLTEGLRADWAEWFAPLALNPGAGQRTELRGTLRDQAELFGMLAKVRDLGLNILTLHVQHTTR